MHGAHLHGNLQHAVTLGEGNSWTLSSSFSPTKQRTTSAGAGGRHLPCILGVLEVYYERGGGRVGQYNTSLQHVDNQVTCPRLLTIHNESIQWSTVHMTPALTNGWQTDRLGTDRTISGYLSGGLGWCGVVR